MPVATPLKVGLLSTVLSVLTYALRGTTAVTGGSVMEPIDACQDFAAQQYTGSGWTLDDCIEVWTDFNNTVWEVFHERMPEADLWRDTAADLRSAGSPCLVASIPNGDGAGSTTIRHMATWIFSREMGCDWVTPDWGKKFVGQGNSTAVMYCHRTATNKEMDPSKPKEELKAMRRCSIVDWLSYFQFDVPSIAHPKGKKVKIVEPFKRSFVKPMTIVKKGLEKRDVSKQPWDNIVFTLSATLASHHLVNIGSWDERKKEIVRDVLGEARRNFHRHPRPWYDDQPECLFEEGREHFAIHVRMGDRRAFYDGNPQYFDLLEGIMGTVTEELRRKGSRDPLFHVFSETLIPCPSEANGLFDEFPTWPVELDQISECLDAITPRDCPEKRAGAFCSPIRSGVFRVRDKPVVLHVGSDVQNAMSCMIQADGILMGCSTFGQIAGLLTEGISLFSTRCSGEATPHQYRSIPPLAVAERGELWVPIDGSWHDPSLNALTIFRAALDTLLAKKHAKRLAA